MKFPKFYFSSQAKYLFMLFKALFQTKRLKVGGKRVNLEIWDTAGQEKYSALAPIYYRNSNGAILVYDITDEDSFQKVLIPSSLKNNKFIVGPPFT